MRLDALLFLQHSDIAHFCANPAPYAGLKQIFIDPGLVEEAVKRGMDPALFDYRPLSVGRHFQARVASEAMTRALALDQELTRERARLFGPGVFQGWDHVGFRFFFLRALVAQALGELCDQQLPEPRIGLFRPRKPQQFYFDAFVSCDLFTGSSSRWQVVDDYDEVANWVLDAQSACFDFEWIGQRAAGLQAVVHIPTVYANLTQYVQGMAGRFQRLIELPSPFWDIPLGRERCPLVPLRDAAAAFVGPQCIAYRELARAVIERHLAGLLRPPHALKMQVDMMAYQCLLQAVNFHGLSSALKGTAAHFVLTEHDTGAVGPLFSVAERLGSEITVLPHSSYPTQPLPHSIRVRAIERDGFATAVRALWGERVTTRAVRFSPRREPVQRQRVRTVCLLLNTLSSRGISHIDFVGMANFHKALTQRCAQRDVRLLVRAKPNASCLPILCGALGVPAESLQQAMSAPLSEVAEASDLCLCHGEMTSAAIDFLEAGSHVLHVSQEIRPTDLLNASPLAAMRTLESLPAAQALACIERLLDDTPWFEAQARRQRDEFAARLTATSDQVFAD